MGVSINAYGKAEHVESVYYDRYGDVALVDGKAYHWQTDPRSFHITFIAHGSWVPRLDGLIEGETYSVTDPMEILRCSYGYYNRIRDNLATALTGRNRSQLYDREGAGDLFPHFKDLPGIDLIDFSDCEGTLGPQACKRIHDALTADPDIKERFIWLQAGDPIRSERIFDNFVKGFGLASKEGMVSFG